MITNEIQMLSRLWPRSTRSFLYIFQFWFKTSGMFLLFPRGIQLLWWPFFFSAWHSFKYISRHLFGPFSWLNLYLNFPPPCYPHSRHICLPGSGLVSSSSSSAFTFTVYIFLSEDSFITVWREGLSDPQVKQKKLICDPFVAVLLLLSVFKTWIWKTDCNLIVSGLFHIKGFKGTTVDSWQFLQHFQYWCSYYK